MRRKATVPELGPDSGAGLGSAPGGNPNRDYGPARGILDTPEPYAGQGLPIPEPVMFGSAPTVAFDGRADAIANRGVGMWLTPQTSPLRELNRTLLVELGTVYGHEGSDFQNPYAWASRGVLAYPSEHGTELVPGYGVGQGQTPNDVALNIAATQHVLLV